MNKIPLMSENILIDLKNDKGNVNEKCSDIVIAHSTELDKQCPIVEITDSQSIMAHGQNNQITKAINRNKEERSDKKYDGKTKVEMIETEVEVLLGSVTTHTHNCVGTRSSARVIQKMKQDQQSHPPGTPPHEKEQTTTRKDERQIGQKTPTGQVRTIKQSWSNLERNYFFDALNEFGKDFEAIGNYVNTKLKRRSPSIDITFKSKDQVRQHFYQTYHKICKYIRFSEEVRKPVQELYALINYGEMRRKIQFITEKHYLKLRNLVYDGQVTVRCKGKNIRIKTPSCKALRRLNQLDDSLEDIKLPSKIEVIVSPANMEAFGHVQTLAQNPRCRTIVPLHKKLINFIKAFQYKWRNYECKLIEEAKLFNNSIDSSSANGLDSINSNFIEPELCFLPKPGVTIHRPLLSITEYLSSVNICLTAYEERMGVKVKSTSLNNERNTITPQTVLTSTQQSNANILYNNKRTRTDSGSDKRSPERMKRPKTQNVNIVDITAATEDIPSDIDLMQKNESSGDELGDEMQELLGDYKETLANCNANVTNMKNDILHLDASNKQMIEENKDNKQIHNLSLDFLTATTGGGGHKDNTATLTTVSGLRSAKRSMNAKNSRLNFKPLLNDDVMRTIRNGWTPSNAGDITIGDLYVVLGHDGKLELDYYWPNTKQNKTNLNTESIILATGEMMISPPTKASTSVTSDNDARHLTNKLVNCTLSNKLKHLLLIANLSERLRKRSCICERNSNAKIRLERDINGRTFLTSNKNSMCSINASDNQQSNFKSPKIPLRRPSIDPVKQLAHLTRQKVSRQVFVQRLLVQNSDKSSNLNIKTDGTVADRLNPIQNNEKLKNNLEETRIDKYENVKVINENHEKKNNAIKAHTTIIKTQTNESALSPAPTSLPLSLSPLNVITDSDITQDQLINTIAIKNTATGISSSIDSAFDECSNNSFLNGLNPVQLIRESTTNSRWLEENINDFSLTSLLGHLDEINASRDIIDPSSNLSVISESSVDYMHKFQEIKALLQSQDKD